jgi:hypothetical protein
MKHKKDWGPGFRLFRCVACGHTWKEVCRDCTSLSSSMCPNIETHDTHDIHSATPYGHEKHYDWPTDSYGNLIEGYDYENKE